MAMAAGELLELIPSVNDKVPATVGVPLITPVAGVSESPVGRLPDSKRQL